MTKHARLSRFACTCAYMHVRACVHACANSSDRYSEESSGEEAQQANKRTSVLSNRSAETYYIQCSVNMTQCQKEQSNGLRKAFELRIYACMYVRIVLCCMHVSIYVRTYVRNVYILLSTIQSRTLGGWILWGCNWLTPLVQLLRVFLRYHTHNTCGEVARANCV